MPLIPRHFLQGPHTGVSGQLRAMCVASMLTMHWQSTDIVIKEESPTLASVVDASDQKNTLNTTKLSNGGNKNTQSKYDVTSSLSSSGSENFD